MNPAAPIFMSDADCDWHDVTFNRARMQRATIFEGDYDVSSAFFKMDAGVSLGRHMHAKWVQVVVLKGEVKVEQEGTETFIAGPESVYFVHPGSTHVETAVTDSLVLITQGRSTMVTDHKAREI